MKNLMSLSITVFSCFGLNVGLNAGVLNHEFNCKDYSGKMQIGGHFALDNDLVSGMPINDFTNADLKLNRVSFSELSEYPLPFVGDKMPNESFHIGYPSGNLSKNAIAQDLSVALYHYADADADFYAFTELVFQDFFILNRGSAKVYFNLYPVMHASMSTGTDGGVNESWELLCLVNVKN